MAPSVAAEVRVAVIMPIAPGETAWSGVVPDLASLPAGSELIFTGPMPPAGDVPVGADLSHLRVSWIKSPLGRARQMNLAARATVADYLWFLHADTRLPRRACEDLVAAVRRAPTALHYFGLRFADGPKLMVVNQLGVWARTRLFGLPFGDQAFCLPRATFAVLGGYDERVPYGEDHMLVWQAARGGVPLRRVPATVATSARKYAERGWGKTTARHLILTLKQALPQWWQTRTKS